MTTWTNTTNAGGHRTYYDVLEIDRNATILDIKGAYKKLALKYHPDRWVMIEEKKLATSKFQDVALAYNCLSDINKKREYDHYLKYSHGNGRGSDNGNTVPFSFCSSPTTNRASSSSYLYCTSYDQQQKQLQRPSPPRRLRTATARYHKQGVDPFAQFEHVFKNDPYFQQAFKNLDDEFERRFQKPHPTVMYRQRQQRQKRQRLRSHPTTMTSQHQKRGRGSSFDSSESGNSNDLGSSFDSSESENSNDLGNSLDSSESENSNDLRNSCNDGWFIWLLHQCGIQMHIQKVRTDEYGNVTASVYSSKTQSSKSTQAYVDEHGQQVQTRRIQSGPNCVEDKYVGGQLIERRVNGKIIRFLVEI